MRASQIHYSDELFDLICERIAEGESMRSICREKGMPAIGTVFSWMERSPTCKEQYLRAREVQAETLADELMDIADEVRGSNDSAVVNAARLAIETRKWAASKMKPNRFGDRVDHNVNQTTTVITRMEIVPVFPEPRDDDDRYLTDGSTEK